MPFVTKINISGIEEDKIVKSESMIFAVETRHKLSNEQLKMLITTLQDTYDFTIGTHKPIEFEKYISVLEFVNLEI